MYNLSFQNYTFSDIYEKMYSFGYPFLALPAPIPTNKKESSVHAAPFRVCFTDSLFHRRCKACEYRIGICILDHCDHEVCFIPYFHEVVGGAVIFCV